MGTGSARASTAISELETRCPLRRTHGRLAKPLIPRPPPKSLTDRTLARCVAELDARVKHGLAQRRVGFALLCREDLLDLRGGRREEGRGGRGEVRAVSFGF